ncbi:uncharacterized protein LOC135370992 [Ornithodoros turicata]|uniref:uncharacterized protein LOC135370992 n=1 Tax=Ornithodoros turicata TaxID=34597 RepID=UPI00313A4302
MLPGKARLAARKDVIRVHSVSQKSDSVCCLVCPQSPNRCVDRRVRWTKTSTAVMKLPFALFIVSMSAGAVVLASPLQRLRNGLNHAFGSPQRSSLAVGGGRYGGYPPGGMPRAPAVGGGYYGVPTNQFHRTLPGSLHRRLRRHVPLIPLEAAERLFSYLRRLDVDKCVQRATCEASAERGRYGKEGQLLVHFILSMDNNSRATWHPYLISARMGKSLGNTEKCRLSYSSCKLNKDALAVVARKRIMMAFPCIQGPC